MAPAQVPPVPEATLWRYVVQLAGALRAVHSAGLALRPACLHPTKVSCFALSSYLYCCYVQAHSFLDQHQTPMPFVSNRFAQNLCHSGWQVLVNPATGRVRVTSVGLIDALAGDPTLAAEHAEDGAHQAHRADISVSVKSVLEACRAAVLMCAEC